MSAILCSNCFNDQGLRLDAEKIGEKDDLACPNCGDTEGRKLTKDSLLALAYRFFVWGTLKRSDYGAAPVVQFNEHQDSNIDTSFWFQQDIKLIGETLGVGFFYYGPRLWMIGEVEPLKALQENKTRTKITRQSEVLPPSCGQRHPVLLIAAVL